MATARTGRAVRTTKLHRQQAEEGVGEVHPLQTGQVLGDDAACAEDEVVHRVALGMLVFENGLVYVEGVYRDGPHPSVHHELRRPAVEEGVVVVTGRAVMLVPACAQDGNDAVRESTFVGPQVFDDDPLAGPLSRTSIMTARPKMSLKSMVSMRSLLSTKW
jgi:hypothetical protein